MEQYKEWKEFRIGILQGNDFSNAFVKHKVIFKELV